MMNREFTGLLFFGLAAGLVGCEGRGLPTPPTTFEGPQTVPQPEIPAFQVADVTVSGVVYEETPTGRTAIAGVLIANGEGWSGLTDANGFFSFKPVWVCPCAAQPAVPAGTTSLWVGKDGYGDPDGLMASSFGGVYAAPGYRDVAVDGDTHVEFELVRR